MNRGREPLETASLIIELAAPFEALAADAPERQALEERLLSVVDDLALDLDLPVDPMVRVRPASQASGAPIRMWLNDAPLRVIRPVPAWPERTSDLYSTIADAIVSNREQFASHSLLDRINRWLLPEAPPAGDPKSSDRRHERLTALLRHGLKVDRAAFCRNGACSQANVVRLTVHMRDPLAEVWADWDEKITSMNDSLFYELGLLVPQVERKVDARLAPEEFRIQINDLRLPTVKGLLPGEIVVNDRAERVNQIAKELSLKVTARETVSPVANRLVFSILEAGGFTMKTLESKGLTTWDPVSYLVLHVAIAIRRHAGSLLSDAIVRQMLNTLKRAFPELTTAAAARYEISAITHVLQALLADGVSILDLRGILDAMLEAGGRAVNDVGRTAIVPASNVSAGASPRVDGNVVADALVEHVRGSLKHEISHRLARGTKTVVAYLLDHRMEHSVRLSPHSALAPLETDAILGAIAAEAQELPATVQIPVILTTADVRCALSRIIALEFTSIRVTSYAELPADMNIQPIARIAPVAAEGAVS